DIFYNNALGNGLLPVMLPDEQVAELAEWARKVHGYRLTVDLERCVIEDDAGLSRSFDIDPFSRHRLLNGLDDIGLTLQHADAITQYEGAREAAALA
ncbi:MAG TPA: 3-isopropylmalate dehydratase small subunit, partial [Chloroflexota bacterium]